MINKR